MTAADSVPKVRAGRVSGSALPPGLPAQLLDFGPSWPVRDRSPRLPSLQPAGLGMGRVCLLLTGEETEAQREGERWGLGQTRRMKGVQRPPQQVFVCLLTSL